MGSETTSLMERLVNFDSVAISIVVCVLVAACLCMDGVLNTLGE